MLTSRRYASSVSSGRDLMSEKGSHSHEEWHSDLLGCCSEPALCTIPINLSSTLRCIYTDLFVKKMTRVSLIL